MRTKLFSANEYVRKREEGAARAERERIIILLIENKFGDAAALIKGENK